MSKSRQVYGWINGKAVYSKEAAEKLKKNEARQKTLSSSAGDKTKLCSGELVAKSR